MIKIKVLQVISGNDNGGGGNHVINICSSNILDMKCEIACIGEGDLYEKAGEFSIPAVSFTFKEMIRGSLVKYIKRNEIDIVNFHGPKANFIYSLIKKKLSIPAVTTIHSDYRYDFLNDKKKKYLYTPLSTMALKKFNNYICVSNYLKELLKHKDFKGDKYVIPNGIDFKKYNVEIGREELRKKYNLKQDDFIYIMVARMHPIKNHINLIKAFNTLQKDFSNVKLLLLGDGELENELKALVNDLNINDKVIFTGFKKHSIDFINASDVSILTSFNEGGAPPLVVLESALVKKTIICSEVGDMPLIINSSNGFLINPYSERDIYDKMKNVYLNKEKLSIKGENLYKSALNKFSIEAFWENYYKTYNEILTGSEVNE
ncbi:putative glycosyltransferase EpsD [Clostridium liquoris]|uniref:Putative glycosyltransferase EpsD n=1 Tax=Clostridium liquoris TaxID=1289519 RepID=A0A2T0B031_9CLOT|nr:glycosyltransferase family 4 protein [Clostridium liquoris]PRR76805.1 putative glycosyltransferase EpsD [Clostridium liquoris]